MKNKEFTSDYGKATFFYREGRNDYYTVLSSFVEDEYDIAALGLGQGDVAIDVGAHIGAVTLLMALMGATVYAYEPVRENYAMLCETLRLNGLNGRISAFPLAITDRRGKALIHLDERDNPHHFIGNFYSDTEETQLVETVSLDDVFADNGINHCAALKIDAEGSEFPILEAASEKTLAKIGCICGEYHTACGPVPRSRASLLALTKGMFDDAAGIPETGPMGHFKFVRRGK